MTKILLLTMFAAAIVSAQSQAVLGEETVKVSDNVWAIMGFPNIAIIVGNRATLAVLDKVIALNALHVLPDHSAAADGSMVAVEKKFISDLRNRSLELKRNGVSADDAGKQLGGEFKTRYPDWPNMNVAGFVRSIYTE